MIYDAIPISYHIINYSNEKKYNISNLKLQKLLYLVQAYFLATGPLPCFDDEIEAWDFGPVVPAVYHRFKQFGSGNIPKLLFQNNDGRIIAVNGKDLKIASEDISKINKVVDRFSKYSADDLVILTHHQDPWINAYERGRSSIITKSSIKEYFTHGK